MSPSKRTVIPPKSRAATGTPRTGRPGLLGPSLLAIAMASVFIVPRLQGQTEVMVEWLAWCPDALQALTHGSSARTSPIWPSLLLPPLGAGLLVTDGAQLLAVGAVLLSAGTRVAQRLGTARFLAFVVISSALSGAVGTIIRLADSSPSTRLVAGSATGWTIAGSALLLASQQGRARVPGLAVVFFTIVQLWRTGAGALPTSGEDLPLSAQLTALLGAPLLLPFFLPPRRKDPS